MGLLGFLKDDNTNSMFRVKEKNKSKIKNEYWVYWKKLKKNGDFLYSVFISYLLNCLYFFYLPKYFVSNPLIYSFTSSTPVCLFSITIFYYSSNKCYVQFVSHFSFSISVLLFSFNDFIHFLLFSSH